MGDEVSKILRRSGPRFSPSLSSKKRTTSRRFCSERYDGEAEAEDTAEGEGEASAAGYLSESG